MTRADPALVLACVALAHCDPGAFDRYRTNTPVMSIPRPLSDDDAFFGRTFAVIAGGDANDWIAVSGGLDSTTMGIPLRSGNTLLPSNPSPVALCDHGVHACAPGGHFGDPLGGIESFAGMTHCALIPTFSTSNDVVRVACIGDGTTSPVTVDVAAPAGFPQSGFGISVAALRRRRDGDSAPGEMFAVGAPTPGHVFVVLPTSTTDVTPTGLPAGTTLGDGLAMGYARSGGVADALLVAGAQNGATVVAWRGDPRVGRPFAPIGCIIRYDEAGFGGVVATADVDGDGDDDVVVGTQVNVVGRAQNIHVYLASQAPHTSTCSSTAWPERAAIPCADDAASTATCVGINAGWGSTIAGGDLDGDGHDEIAVGAPTATVSGVLGAGAVWVLHFDANVTPTTASVVSSLHPFGNLGTQVGIARLGTRDELLATEPGDTYVRLFLCTGIPGDAPGTPGLGPNCR